MPQQGEARAARLGRHESHTIRTGKHEKALQLDRMINASRRRQSPQLQLPWPIESTPPPRHWHGVRTCQCQWLREPPPTFASERQSVKQDYAGRTPTRLTPPRLTRAAWSPQRCRYEYTRTSYAACTQALEHAARHAPGRGAAIHGAECSCARASCRKLERRVAAARARVLGCQAEPARQRYAPNLQRPEVFFWVGLHVT